MATKVIKLGIKRAKGFLYYIDKKGDVSRKPMARAGKKQSFKAELIEKAGLKREKGYLYFIDKQGDIAKAAMKRGGTKKKKAAKKAKQ